MSTYLKFNCLVLAMSLFMPLNAQLNNCEKGNDETKIESSLYREYYKNKNYKSALPHWRKVFTDAPGIGERLFQNGIIMYSEFAKQAEDPLPYVDTMLLIYQKRMQCWGDSAIHLNKIAGLLRYYFPDRKAEILSVFKFIHSIEATALSESHFSYWFKLEKELWELGQISDADLLSIFYELNNKASAETQFQLELILPAQVLSCEMLLEECKKIDFELTKDTIIIERLIRKFNRVDGECRKEKAYADILIAYVKIIPSSKVYRQLAEVLPTDSESILMYIKALHLETDDLEKAKLAYKIAVLSKEEGDYSNAMQMAKLSIKCNSTWALPYILVGDIIIEFDGDCKDQDLQIKILRALDYYNRAVDLKTGSAELAAARINIYTSHMPKYGFYFMRNIELGDKYPIGCWIKEETTIRIAD